MKRETPKDWAKRSVLITGGTGSFGRKLTQALLEKHPPRRLIIFSRDELKQHEMREEMDAPCLRFFLGDVRDRSRLNRALHGVDLVIHAAALKQVPACEYNPFEAVRTNVLGSQNVLDACIDSGVSKAVLISTDKAVNPVNLYGATKLCAEKLWIQGNSYSGDDGTLFSCVRYGNVVGSRGSVVPLFQEQAKKGVVTVTDTRMTRFWISLDYVVQFVINCIDLMAGGETFIPKIPSAGIMDLVKAIAPEAKLNITGIRPGEKLHEVLLGDDEARQAVELDDMYVVRSQFPQAASNPAVKGKPLPDGFRYASDTNVAKLTPEELRTNLK